MKKKQYLFFIILFLFLAVSALGVFTFLQNRGIIIEDWDTEIVDISYFSNTDGRILFQSNNTGNFQIYSIEPSGNGLIRITNNDHSDEYPVYSPDMTKIAFHRRINGSSNIMIKCLETGKETEITSGNNRFHDPAFLNDSILAFDCEREMQIYFAELDSLKIRQFTDFSGRNILPAFSPDEKYMAFTRSPLLGWNVYNMELKSHKITKITDGFGACRPRFHPDSRTMAYVSEEGDGIGEIWIIDIHGENKKRITNFPETYDYYPSYSPDGKNIVFSRVKDDKKSGAWDIWIITADGRKAAQLTSFTSQEKFPCWSR